MVQGITFAASQRKGVGLVLVLEKVSLVLPCFNDRTMRLFFALALVTTVITWLGCGSSSSHSSASTVPASLAAGEPDSVAQLRAFWQQMQSTVATGDPQAMREHVAFPLYSFGMPVSEAEFMAHYREIIWPEADSLLLFIPAQALAPTDLSPYQIKTLDHPAGYSTLISRRDQDHLMGMVYFIGRVGGQYQLVGYATSSH
jgi:hypothetical protein